MAESSHLVFRFTRALLSESQWGRVKQVIKEVSLKNAVAGDADALSKLSRGLLYFIDQELEVNSSPIREVCEYELGLLEWKANQVRPGIPNGKSAGFLIDQVGLLFPAILGYFKVVTFSSGTEAIDAVVKGGHPLPGKASKTKVLFHSDSVPLSISDQTEHLLDAIVDGSKTTDEVIKAVSNHYQFEDQHAHSRFKEDCLSALEGLYWAGIIELREMPFARA